MLMRSFDEIVYVMGAGANDGHLGFVKGVL